jgi:hypothetical protein
MHRSTTTFRLVALAAALLLGASATACGSADGDDDATTTTEAPATTEGATDEGEDEGSEEEPTDADADGEDEGTEEESSGEVETTGLLEFLQAEDAAIGDLFDWNTQAGVIAITYLGTQTVQLYHYEALDPETAIAACELASEHVFPIDDAAAIEVRSGQYPDGAVVASVSGADGTCAAA